MNWFGKNKPEIKFEPQHIQCIKHSTQHSITFPTPQSLSKILCYVLYFQRSSRCLEMWLNTVFHAWYNVYYINETTTVVCYSFKEVRAKLWHFLFSLQGFAWDTPFIWEIHFGQHWRAWKPIIFAIVFLTNRDCSFQNQRCTAHVLICSS